MLGDPYVGPEHLLLAIFRETQGLGFKVLWNLGLRYDSVQNAVIAKRSQTNQPCS